MCHGLNSFNAEQEIDHADLSSSEMAWPCLADQHGSSRVVEQIQQEIVVTLIQEQSARPHV